MRPRRDAAENLAQGRPAIAHLAASMRTRRDAAENPTPGRLLSSCRISQQLRALAGRRGDLRPAGEVGRTDTHVFLQFQRTCRRLGLAGISFITSALASVSRRPFGSVAAAPDATRSWVPWRPDRCARPIDHAELHLVGRTQGDDQQRIDIAVDDLDQRTPIGLKTRRRRRDRGLPTPTNYDDNLLVDSTSTS